MLLIIVFISDGRVAAAQARSSGPITLDAGALRCVLERTDGGVRLSRLVNRRRHTELAAKKASPLFEVVMEPIRDGKPRQEGMLILKADGGWRQVRSEPTDDHGGVSIHWSGPRQAGIEGVRVTVLARPKANDDALHWSISVHNDSDRWSVHEVVFPQVSLADWTGGHGTLFYPRKPGTLEKNPWSGFNWQHSYPGGGGCNMQYLALYAPGGTGFYFGLHDPKPTIKLFAARSGSSGKDEKSGATLRLRVDQPAPNLLRAGNDFSLSGEGVWRLFRGDWFDAAKIYRRWVRRKAGWYPKMGPSGRADTPMWMRTLPVWMRIDTRKASDIQPAIKRVEKFAQDMGVPVGLHWYSWHQIPFNKDYPHFFPPKKGFADAVKELQAHGVYVMPYINARMWDVRDVGGKDVHFSSEARPYAQKDVDGHVYTTESNFQKEPDGSPVRYAIMCPATDFYQNKIRDLALRLFDQYHVKAVYLDQLNSRAFAEPISFSHKLGDRLPLCYDPDHGHTLGGGDWWSVGYRHMLEKIHAKMPPDTILVGEHLGEWNMAQLNGVLTPGWRKSHLVPAALAVYGGGAQQVFGRYFNKPASHPVGVRQMAGLELVYGEQLGWWKPDIMQDSKTLRYLRRLIRVRYRKSRYFYAGQMARPIDLTGKVPTRTTTRAGGGRPEVTTNAILTGSWAQPDTHKLLLLFVNPTDQAVTTTIDVNLRDYGFTGRQVKMHHVGPEKDAANRLVPLALRRQVTFAPASLTAWEITPAEAGGDEHVYENSPK